MDGVLVDSGAHHREAWSRMPAVAVAGVVAFVDTLRAHAVPLAVATSARRADAVELLEPLGLLDRFAVIVAAEDVTRGKPDPEAYLQAARRLGATPESCLVFEDAIVGVQAARGSGMRVFGVATAYDPADLLAAGAERVIATFEGLAWPL